jgi:NADH:ubiquinone oxidoreductase subunit 6 (subunit J)
VRLEAVGFWVLSVILVTSSLAVVLTPNLFHAVLYLAVALVTTGVVFLLLQSPFLFGVQLLLYAGGVVTIVVFAIMLTERLIGDRITQTNRHVVNGAIVSAALFVAVLGLLGKAPAPAAVTAPGTPAGTAAMILPGAGAAPSTPAPAGGNRTPASGMTARATALSGAPAQSPGGAPAPGTAPAGSVVDQVAGLGRALTGPYALALELLGVLLVGGLMGAVYFAREDE